MPEALRRHLALMTAAAACSASVALFAPSAAADDSGIGAATSRTCTGVERVAGTPVRAQLCVATVYRPRTGRTKVTSVLKVVNRAEVPVRTRVAYRGVGKPIPRRLGPAVSAEQRGAVTLYKKVSTHKVLPWGLSTVKAKVRAPKGDGTYGTRRLTAHLP